MTKFKIVYITFPSKKEAEEISQILIRERLAACCNIFNINSIFSWEGKIQKVGEYAVFVKTKENLVDKIIKRVKKLHSYSTPCIVSFSLERGLSEFFEWIERSTQ
jgi:periplasmic divalent cation tolerance protein